MDRAVSALCDTTPCHHPYINLNGGGVFNLIDKTVKLYIIVSTEFKTKDTLTFWK